MAYNYMISSKKKFLDRSSSSGQALVEFIVGMVALLVAAVAILSIAVLTRGDTESFVDAHQRASELSLKTGIPTSFQDVKDVSAGSDNRFLTSDDKIEHGTSLNQVRQNVVAMGFRSSGQEAMSWPDGSSARYDELSAIGSGNTSAFGMERGRSGLVVELPTAVRTIFGIDIEQRVDNEVWLPQTGGLY